MKKLKIACVTATRADYPRVKPLLQKIKSDKYFDLKIIVTGQHLLSKYGNTYKEIIKDGFKINYKIPVLRIKKNNLIEMTESMGKLVLKLPKILSKIKPDIVLITVDRVETLASAMVCSFLNYPIAHIQGGEVTGAVDENIRHAVTKLSHYHFVANNDAYKRLIKLGENKENIFNVGCPYVDTINEIKNRTKSKEYFKKKYNIDLKKKTIIFIQHPVTKEIDKINDQIKIIINALNKFSDINIISFFSNSDSGGQIIIKKLKKINNIKIFPNMLSEDFLSLMKYASCMVGNSSAAIREAPSFQLPCINIGSRQNKRLRAKNVIDVNFDEKNIVYAIKKALNDPSFKKKLKYIKNPYGRGNASAKIVKILKKIKNLKNVVKTKVITY